MYYPPLEGYVSVRYYITSVTCPNGLLVSSRSFTSKYNLNPSRVPAWKSQCTIGVSIRWPWKFEWDPHVFNPPSWLVSKVTLDIICETAFGYRADSVHNPNNELASAYHELINLQNGQSGSQQMCFPWIPFAQVFNDDQKRIYSNRFFFSYNRAECSALHNVVNPSRFPAFASH